MSDIDWDKITQSRNESDEKIFACPSGSQVKQVSYTDQLITHLCNEMPDCVQIHEVISHIKTFADIHRKKNNYANKSNYSNSNYRTSGGSENVFRFGKYKGKKISEIIKDDAKYLTWLNLQNWVSDDVKIAITKLMNPKSLN